MKLVVFLLLYFRFITCNPLKNTIKSRIVIEIFSDLNTGSNNNVYPYDLCYYFLFQISHFMTNNERNCPCSFPAPLSSYSIFIKEATGFINEDVIGFIKEAK